MPLNATERVKREFGRQRKERVWKVSHTSPLSPKLKGNPSRYALDATVRDVSQVSANRTESTISGVKSVKGRDGLITTPERLAEPPKPERIKRTCLRCERKFFARGRFNRICGSCRKVNSQIDPDWFGVEAHVREVWTD